MTTMRKFGMAQQRRPGVRRYHSQSLRHEQGLSAARLDPGTIVEATLEEFPRPWCHLCHARRKDKFY